MAKPKKRKYKPYKAQAKAPKVKKETMKVEDIDDFDYRLVNDYANKGQTEMEINGFTCTLNMPAAVERKVDKDGVEHAAQLPPYGPRPAFKVDEYPACPVTWEHGSSKAGSYFVPVKAGLGMWFDLTKNMYHPTHHVAAVISIQGINPITGLKTDPIRLEQYRENCPKHNIPFKQDLFCEKCNYKWPAQNYLSSNNGKAFWLDGFMTENGVVRQWLFTEEECKGVAAQLIGKDRVHAIGIAFYLSKNEKPKPKYDFGVRGMSLCASGGGSITNYATPCSIAYDSCVESSFNVSSVAASGPVGTTVSLSAEEKTSGGILMPDGGEPRGESTKSKRTRGPRGSSAALPEASIKKLEIGAGAKINQTIGRDPESLDFWQAEPAAFIYVNYCTIEDAKRIIDAGKREEKAEGFVEGLKLAN